MSSCEPHHDAAQNALTAFMCLGITISYLPQHWRIISAKSSEGFSPWFLLLGSMSSASGMLNIIVMQWGIIKCCRVLSAGSCLESIAGVLQLSLVWVLFVMILVLYMIYYPPHLKYVELDVNVSNDLPPQHIKTPVKREQWKLSIVLSWAVFLHIAFIIFVTFLLLSTNPMPSPDGSEHLAPQLQLWATFLGVSSALLATFQYTPQIVHTYRLKLVGALSIPMMLLQTPGAVLMVLSIALRPGTNWTTWITYAVAGLMQGILLAMCIVFHARQRRLGVDDFGRPLHKASSNDDDEPSSTPSPVEAEVGDAVHSDVRSEHGVDVVEPEREVVVGEETPLLGKPTGAAQGGRKEGGLLAIFAGRRR
ncbi:hypothetical protein FKP32DRAFT_1640427 [Trametes sanguinea]|nr:hypothetical protein FKP32DRAFT_1640427 [Trametes sanguinea]